MDMEEKIMDDVMKDKTARKANEGTRLEHDSIGTQEVPENAYYGVQTQRAARNFNITGLNMHPELIVSVAQIKKSAADRKSVV